MATLADWTARRTPAGSRIDISHGTAVKGC